MEAAAGGGEASKPLLAKASKEAPPLLACFSPPLPPPLKYSVAFAPLLPGTTSLSWELSAHVGGES